MFLSSGINGFICRRWKLTCAGLDKYRERGGGGGWGLGVRCEQIGFSSLFILSIQYRNGFALLYYASTDGLANLLKVEINQAK